MCDEIREGRGGGWVCGGSVHRIGEGEVDAGSEEIEREREERRERE